jgi:sulfoxide reductase heme-binding subunit YedZ
MSGRPEAGRRGQPPQPLARSAGLPVWLKPLVFALAVVPLARLFVLGMNDGLGANPVEFVTRSTGTWALVMLCVTLAVTPLRRLSGWTALVRLRRMLGLFAFFYAVLHFTVFVWLEHWFDLGAMLADVLDRPFVMVGFLALLLMLPLALTSTQAMMRRLGRRWQTLHRLIYLVAPLAVLHFWWHKAGKNDFFEPAIYGLVVAALLLARLLWRSRGTQASRGTVARKPAGVSPAAPAGAVDRATTRTTGQRTAPQRR